ncbi:hypothetical protein L195_g008575 [Trifolium pratense]|uniref:Uncharacterized protein n=1 Tax=Trifolium pratense TaxID=57577 RepID=A0A2K3P9I7_TRIPR|nr:hypothetical protein L195_g008575 [Trifolium pratense]
MLYCYPSSGVGCSTLVSGIDRLEQLYESHDQKSHPAAPWKEQGHGSYEARQSLPSSGNHFENSHINGPPRVQPNDQLPVDNVGHSQLSSPFMRSISPSRHLPEGDHDSRPGSPRQGLMPMSETNNSNSLLKQDLAINVREREEEIILLRKHLADYSAKEAQIRNEKYVLEKRIAYMRLAFDQQQQDLVDAASKALSYRQDIIEENIRLTYALQDPKGAILTKQLLCSRICLSLDGHWWSGAKQFVGENGVACRPFGPDVKRRNQKLTDYWKHFIHL